jgi:hypothetical protein
MLAAVTFAHGAQSTFYALSNDATTGLILGLGMGCSFALVLGLTIRAARLSNRERAANRPAANRAQSGHVRRGRSRARGAAQVETAAGYDAYPPQPYSTREPTSHKPYSRPYRVPAQDQPTGAHHSNGSRPAGTVGLPNTPWPPSED